MSDGSGKESVVKYGVISSQMALTDLSWVTTLYIAGRLQKPVKHLYHHNDALKLANEYNLECALNFLLLLYWADRALTLSTARNFLTRSHWYLTWEIRAWSSVGKIPTRFKNIVKKQLPFFKYLYKDALEKAISKGYVIEAKGLIAQTLGIDSAVRLVADLPKTYKKLFLNTFKRKHGRVLEQDLALLDFLAEKPQRIMIHLLCWPLPILIALTLRLFCMTRCPRER